MRPKTLSFRDRRNGLTDGRGRTFLTFGLLSVLLLIALLYYRISESSDPKHLLAEADHLAWLSNWQRAGELYARAEGLAAQRGDKRDQLYAACGRLRSTIGAESVAETLAELTPILQDPLAKTDPALRIRCLTTKAEIQREDNPDSEHQIWQEVFDLARGLGDKSWQARAQAELSIIEFMNGNTERAAKLLKSALGSAFARADLPTLVIYGSEAGNGFNEMGRAGEALEYCNAALHVAAMVRDMGFPYLAYGCKARALAMLGKEAEARQLQQLALRETRRLNMRLEQTQVLIALGQLAAAAKDPPAAIEYYEEASALSRTNGFIHSIAWSKYEAAKVFRDEGQYAEAERCATEAMQAMKQVGDEYHLPLHLVLLADLKTKEGELAKAEELYEKAADVTESILVNSCNEQVKTSLIATMSDVYRGGFAVAANLSHTSEAFRIVETARGRSIADLLRRPETREVEFSDSQKAAEAEVNRLQRTLMETSDRSERRELLDKLFFAEQLMGERMRPATPMQDATLRTQPVDLAKLQSVLLPDEAVLEYVLADPASFCMVTDRNRVSIIQLPSGQKDIEELTSRYLQQVKAEKYDNEDAKKLYDVLLAPIPNLPRTARLTIIPDGKYVVRSHALSYVPSSTVLYYLRTLRRPIEPQMAFLGIGAVPYDLEPKDTGTDRGIMRTVSRGIYDLSGAHLYRLPASRQEILSAEQALNQPRRTVLLLGADATESKFKSEPLSNFKIIHFAVHGLSTPQFPDRAALILGRDPKSNEDGLLQVREIMQLSLAADLVTLSACDTATGRPEGEEGIDGLVEPFLLAGAKSVLGALWDVKDTAAMQFMTNFYTQLARGEDIASALRQAKLDYLENMGDPPPAYWAAFVLVGDGSAPIGF